MSRIQALARYCASQAAGCEVDQKTTNSALFYMINEKDRDIQSQVNLTFAKLLRGSINFDLEEPPDEGYRLAYRFGDDAVEYDC